METILLSFIVSILVQFIFGSIAIIQKSDKVTDLSYSLTFIVLALVNLSLVKDPSIYIIVSNILVILWGIRLGAYLFIRINKIKKDNRFDGVRENPLRFFMFWFFQAISVPIIMLPVSIGMQANMPASLSNLSYVFVVMWIIGFIFETVADLQKFYFKNDPQNRGKWMDTGLWRYSRHPNYFGELLMWWSIYAFVISAAGFDLLLAIIGPIYISILILFITGIPTLQKRYDKKYLGNAEYLEYKNSTRLLLPLPRLGK